MQDQDTVRAAEERADELHRKAYPDLYKGDGDPAGKADDTKGETDEEKAARLKAEEEAKAKEEAERKKKEEEDRLKAEQTWEHKYKVLQGKYGAEVPRLHKQLAEEKKLRKAAEDKAAALEEKLNRLDSSSSGSADTPAENLKREFPEIEAGTRAIVREEVSKITPAPKKDDAAAPADPPPDDAIKAFYGALTEIVSDWETINVEEGFKKWIVQKEKYARRTRLEDLRDAFQEFDAAAVAAFFTGYKEERDAKSDAEKAAEAERLEKEKADRERAAREAEEVHPDTRGRGPADPDDKNRNKDKITADEIAQFYRDDAKGLYEGREAERAAMEAKIIRASREGRVVRARR